jgi:DNA polymerase (family 10)
LAINLELLYNNEGIEGLLKIPSIGKTIASNIQEYLTTGKIQYYHHLKSKLPANIDEFYDLKDIGPKTLKLLCEKLKIKDINELEKAAVERKIRAIPGFSQKKEENILKKIKIYRLGKAKFLLGDVYPLAKQIESRLSQLDFIEKSIIVGSILRMKESISNIDYLVVSDLPHKVIESFVNIPEVKEVLRKEKSKAIVKLNNEIDCNLNVVTKERYALALQYLTGSKEHMDALKRIAQSKDLILNEQGLFNLNLEEIANCHSEEGIYHTLGLQWIPPEMRENTGEIELAKKTKINKHKLKENRLFRLIGYNDLKGDLQVHTNYTDGKMTIEEMAYFAKKEFDLDYIAITDHTKSLKITRGLNEEQLLNQVSKIAEINDKIKSGNFFISDYNKKNSIYENYEDNSHQRIDNLDFRILSSAEVNILKDGSLDISNNVLDKLDIVGATIHSSFSLPVEIQTKRLVNAAQNPNVDIIFHPTGRIINKREGYPVNINKLIETAKDTNTILEIDAYYDRLDLKDEFIKLAIEHAVKLVIDSDAHHPLHFSFLKFGIGQARRGWAAKNDILNTLPVQNLMDYLK